MVRSTPTATPTPHWSKGSISPEKGFTCSVSAQ